MVEVIINSRYHFKKNRTMETEQSGPVHDRGDNRSEEDKKTNSTQSSGIAGKEKRKHFKVLHEDGSFADLPYNNQPGGGAEEGVVGIGT